MSETEKKSPVITWAKQLTTLSKTGLTRKVINNQWVRRNWKPMMVYLMIFLLIALVGHFFIRNAQQTFQQEFFEKGILAAENTGEKIRAPLLEKDVLALNIAVGELQKKFQLVYTAIVDHDDIVIAHSNADLIGETYTLPENITETTTKNGIVVDRFVYEETPVVGFSKELFFSNIKIGKILFGFNADELDGTVKKYNQFLVIIWTFCFFGFLIALFFTDRYLKIKHSKEMDAFNKMEKVGPYRLIRRIAQGGMAELYLAEYLREDGFRRTVAIKKILPHLVENQDFVEMFVREARLAANLQHPNIVQIYDLIKLHNSSFISMEFVDGKNLAQIMAHEKKGLPLGLAIFLIQKISLGLYYSHTRTNDETGESLNIIHRDISPQNMLISFKGEVKISDFGISKARSEPSFTQAGVIKGKLAYLSPEQALGKEIDHQADLYALGIIFYEILTGKRLYTFNNELEALSTLPNRVIRPVIEVRTEVPPALNDIVMKCLEKNKSQRYQSGREIYDDLAKVKIELNLSYDESNLADFMTERFRE
jgi:tRNA A-37 threonylcarbamoyl transferase component Bud32